MAFRGPGRPRTLANREDRRRRGLLIGIATLLILSVGPVFGHHFATGLEGALQGMDHLGALCLIALHEILQPVHRSFHVLIAAGVLWAIADRVRATRRLTRTLAFLEAHQAEGDDPIGRAARAARLPLGTVQVVRGLPNPAFTAGTFRPRVYVAAELAELLEPAELEAVLAHEGAHVARRDPLRLSGLRALALSLFWLPALRRLADDVADEAEIRADDAVAQGRSLELASSILKLANWKAGGVGDAVGFAQRVDLTERRIRRLAGEEPLPGSRVTYRSLVGAALALLLVLASGAVVAHPLPEDHVAHPASHCGHPGESAFEHLFCRWGAPDDGICPHGETLSSQLSQTANHVHA